MGLKGTVNTICSERETKLKRDCRAGYYRCNWYLPS